MFTSLDSFPSLMRTTNIPKNAQIIISFIFLVAVITVPLGIFLKRHYQVVPPYDRDILSYKEVLNFTGLDERRWSGIGKAFQDLRKKNIDLNNARIEGTKLVRDQKIGTRQDYFGSFYRVAASLALPNQDEKIQVKLFGKTVTDFERLEQVDRENFSGEILTRLFHDSPVPFLNYRTLSMNSLATSTCPYISDPKTMVLESLDSTNLYFISFQFIFDLLISDTVKHSYIQLSHSDVSFPLRFDRAKAGFDRLSSGLHPVVRVLQERNLTSDTTNQVLKGLRDGIKYLNVRFPSLFDDLNSVRSIFSCRDNCGAAGVFSQIIFDAEKNIQRNVKPNLEKITLSDSKESILHLERLIDSLIT